MRGSAVLLLVSLAACNKKGADDGVKHSPPPSVNVSVADVAHGPTPVTLTLTGMIAADQRSEVTADTQGKVLAVMVERGQRVKMGDPVVRLDVRSAALGAREAQANLAAARAQKGLAEEECKRTKQLLEKGAITRSEYDRQSTQCTSALEQVSAAQARAEMMTKGVADGMVRAPFAGIVADKNVTPGEWVAPGRALFTLVDDDPLKIELSVPENAVQSVRKDQPVVLRATALPCVSFNAKVSRIGGEIGRTRSLIVEAIIDKTPVPDKTGCERVLNPSITELVPGMFAEAKITVDQLDRAIVPATAVAVRGKTQHAFVIINGELQDRVVLTGPSGQPDTVAILRGDVNKGDKVATGISNERGIRPEIVDGAKVGGAAPAAPATEKPAAEKPTPAPAAPAPSTGSNK